MCVVNVYLNNEIRTNVLANCTKRQAYVVAFSRKTIRIIKA